jgi:hypothetical protein
MNHLLAIITTLGIFLSAGSSYAHADEEPKFITSEGTHRLFDGLIEVTVFEMDGMLNTLFKGDMRPVYVNIRPPKAFIKKNSNWFLYPVNRLEIWMYSGDKDLYLYRQDEFDGRLLDDRVFVRMNAEKAKFNKLPKTVWDRLSDEAKVGLEVGDDYRPTFLTKSGTYNLFDGKLTIKVSEIGDVVRHEFAEKSRSKGILKDDEKPVFPRLPDMKKDARWFIYPVHASEIWIYHGDDDLWIYAQPDFDGKAWNPSNHNFFKMTSLKYQTTRVPQAVLDRLPEPLKKKLKGE